MTWKCLLARSIRWFRAILKDSAASRAERRFAPGAREPRWTLVRPDQVTSPSVTRFDAAFASHHRAVLAYALRRVPTEADAEDVVAETFAVAWRRVDRLPEPDLARPWLLAIARRIVANQRRGSVRRFRLSLRLRAEAPPMATPPDVETPALEALARLRPDDQELLRLLAWDGLSQAEAGVVLGISANAVAIRLYRARRRFADELARVGGEDVKGSAPDRTSGPVEGRLPGRHSYGEHEP